MKTTFQTIRRSGYIHHIRICGIDLIQLLEGTSVRTKPHDWFGLQISESAFDQAVAGIPRKQIDPSSGYTPCLIRKDGQWILFDTGRGWSPDENRRGTLIESLAHAEVGPERIAKVIISHGHPDHVGGLIDSGGFPQFENANIAVGRAEFQHWAGNEEISEKRQFCRSKFRKTFDCLSERVEFIDVDGPVAPGVRAVSTPGHTPSHLSFLLDLNGQSLLILGDVATHPYFSFRHPEWHSQVDDDPVAAAISRRKTLEWCARENLLVSAFHLPFPGLGRVRKSGDAFEWVPESV